MSKLDSEEKTIQLIAFFLMVFGYGVASIAENNTVYGIMMSLSGISAILFIGSLLK
jgi:hypothetical protein